MRDYPYSVGPCPLQTQAAIELAIARRPNGTIVLYVDGASAAFVRQRSSDMDRGLIMGAALAIAFFHNAPAAAQHRAPSETPQGQPRFVADASNNHEGCWNGDRGRGMRNS